MPKITPPCKVWQWDINDTVTVEGIENISEWQVHFATVGDTTALVIEIRQDMTAYIPNQLVELGTAIYAYLYNVREERAYTETAVLIPVNSRPKPSDYISEPTDVLTWGQLRADIGALTDLMTDSKSSLVAAVNELHGDIETASSEIDSIETTTTGQGQSITAIKSEIKEIEQSITDINDIDTAQSQAISQVQEDIDELEQSDTQLTKSVSSLAQTVGKGFERIQTELDKKQPVGDYITNAVDNLVNYYLKSETYTQSEVKDLIGSLTHINIEVISSIDDVTEPNIIYLVPVSGGESDDYYNEYILVNGSPELIGNTRVDLSDYYTKAQTDDLLDDKQPIGSYVTSVNGTTPDEGGNVEIDVQTYTAGEGIDISESGEITVTNPMDDEQVSVRTTWSSENTIKNLCAAFEESGSIITCYPVEGSPLHVVSDITAVQEGEGDPSPDNVRPIVGWTGANLVRCGTNLWPDYIVSTTYPNGSTVTVNDDGWIDVHKVAGSNISQQMHGVFLPLSTYTLSNGINSGSTVYFQVGQSNGNALYTATYPANTGEILLRDSRMFLYSESDAIADVSLRPSLNTGSSALPYEPYRGQTYTADFGETVYGGTLDWTTGVLTVTWERIKITSKYNYVEVASWSNAEQNSIAIAIAKLNRKNGTTNILSDKLKYNPAFVSDLTAWTYLGNRGGKEIYVRIPGNTLEQAKQNMFAEDISIVIELANPYTIQLSPQQILAISGLNTVYCDTGDVTVTGYEDPRHTVAQLTSRIAALESAATGI